MTADAQNHPDAQHLHEFAAGALGDDDLLGEAAVGVVAEHLAGRAELLVAGGAVVTVAADQQVVKTDAVAGPGATDGGPDSFDHAGDLGGLQRARHGMGSIDGRGF